jgi:S-formylglutathione hydrolase FrmB
MAYENPTDARDQQVKLYLNEYYLQKAKRMAAKRKKQLATFLFEELAKMLEAQEEKIDEQSAA